MSCLHLSPVGTVTLCAPVYQFISAQLCYSSCGDETYVCAVLICRRHSPPERPQPHEALNGYGLLLSGFTLPIESHSSLIFPDITTRVDKDAFSFLLQSVSSASSTTSRTTSSRRTSGTNHRAVEHEQKDFCTVDCYKHINTLTYKTLCPYTAACTHSILCISRAVLDWVAGTLS